MKELNPDAIILPFSAYDAAAELAEHTYAAIMLVGPRDAIENRKKACVMDGLFFGSTDDLENLVPQFMALCIRLRSFRKRANTLQRKLDDTRLVNRAKLLLMHRLKMSEAEAHRYIEKTAMDTGQRMGEVAVGIIRTYED